MNQNIVATPLAFLRNSGKRAGPVRAARHWAGLLREFARNPRDVGSIAPSSPVLSRAVASRVPHGARLIVELGPGTGPITRALLHRAAPDAVVVAVEIDSCFCALLHDELPDKRLVIVNHPAEHLREIVAPYQMPVDAVVTSLPLMNFPSSLRGLIIDAIQAVVKPGGIVTGFSYSPVHTPQLLRQTFGNCRTNIVWRNIPPAFVFRSVR
ncbi:MAG: phospholipid methyltransferase [Proteobacteria bacterium]|nr:phospholipid methyltransferase [Pseudomonadota bacterium]NDE06452.1 phospholipid methyltransferase [Chloroflexota bacterium]NDE75539.1 phospholipid methyltransferase [Pseudomonadota bacterium]NDF54316.1 phospholipid methyltransferase [Pseudomonadota bacterium]NDF94361.1 phospholipid methyltransferase [Pseudomonadota bacterium]